jgi:hypothetical protein
MALSWIRTLIFWAKFLLRRIVCREEGTDETREVGRGKEERIALSNQGGTSQICKCGWIIERWWDKED